MRALKVLSVLLGVLFAIAGAVSVAAGGFVLGLDRFHGASSGFVVTPGQALGSNGFALTIPDVNGQLVAGWQRWALTQSAVTVRVTGTSQLPAPIFIGVAPTPQASVYLSGVTRDRVTSIDLAEGAIDYEHVDGTRLPTPPGREGFWVAKTSGTGSRTLEWRLEEGDWAVVIMNADASAPVVAEVALAARFGIVKGLIAGLTAGGALLLGIGAALVVFGAGKKKRVSLG